jgi:hypothetical protein
LDHRPLAACFHRSPQHQQQLYYITISSCSNQWHLSFPSVLLPIWALLAVHSVFQCCSRYLWSLLSHIISCPQEQSCRKQCHHKNRILYMWCVKYIYLYNTIETVHHKHCDNMMLSPYKMNFIKHFTTLHSTRHLEKLGIIVTKSRSCSQKKVKFKVQA